MHSYLSKKILPFTVFCLSKFVPFNRHFILQQLFYTLLRDVLQRSCKEKIRNVNNALQIIDKYLS